MIRMGITKKEDHAPLREKHLEMMPKVPKKHPKIAALRVTLFSTLSPVIHHTSVPFYHHYMCS
jgi:hypothetical protein